MGRIGIFGGTFNPVHLGHVSLACQVKQLKQLDRVLIIPTNQPPHKNCTDLADNADRFAMCSLAFGDLDGFEVSDLEFELGGSSYTIITLLELKRRFPDDELYLIVGGDMILSFDSWKDYQQILKLAVVLAGARSQSEHDEMCEKAEQLMQQGGGRVEVIDISVTEMSSTQVRARLQNNSDCAGYLDERVLAYIQDKQLYRGDWFTSVRPLVKKLLSPNRYYHSECVARRAEELAERFGANPEKAKLAGLLHDVMKNRTDNYLLQYFDRNAIILSDIEKNSPPLWHSIAGAFFVRQELGIGDADIFRAIRYHTTARANMSVLEKVIYIADCISEDRKFDGVEEERKLAKKSLDKALLHSLRHNIAWLAQAKRPLHPDSIDAYNQLIMEG